MGTWCSCVECVEDVPEPTPEELAAYKADLVKSEEELARYKEINEDLRTACHGLMEFQVKNVKVWHNSAYDYAHHVLNKNEVIGVEK